MKSENPLVSLVVALLFLVLVGLIFWRATEPPFNRENFQTIWTAVGPLIGVVTGAIPSYFFRT
jgi:divalent metal cation (Fe/Co/Zn/Cd) transporter